MVHVKVMKQDMYVYVMTDTVVLIVIQVCYTYIYIYIYTRVTRRAPHVKQELITQPEIRCPPSRFLVPVRIARSLVFCVLFCRSLFVFLSFYLGL